MKNNTFIMKKKESISKKLIALLLGLFLSASCMELAPMSVQAAVSAVPISSITYDFSITGVQNESSLEFQAQTSQWETLVGNIDLNGDGNYSLTLSPTWSSEVEGLKNLGYVMQFGNTNIALTLNRIIINGNQELTFSALPVIYVTGGNNGLSNIWNTQPNTTICSNDESYLAVNSNGELIVFYSGSSGGNQGGGDNGDTSRSQNYVNAMGQGWNLGNSFDGFDSNLNVVDKGEESWGNPIVTRDLIAAIKAKGFDSIRIPLTIYRRYSINQNAQSGEYKYVINSGWLARYREVVDWAVDEGLYVMINLHHDSWIWLKNWDGSTYSEEYRMFTDFWKQLAVYFADAPDEVCFETINEPDFTSNAQHKLDVINRAAYDIIRSVAGNETRMIVMPTLHTNHNECQPLFSLIRSLNDVNIIATVHYYSEWVYSANLGKTGFDEELWNEAGYDIYTPRVAADAAMKKVYNAFTANNIAVVIGEYGLLGYDASEDCLDTGEELKYYEYMYELARKYNFCLMFWDNGSGINRRDNGIYAWKQPLVGAMLEASIAGRSSYSTGNYNIYFAEQVQSDVAIPLTLNGNTFTGIVGLTEGNEYTYNPGNATVVLKKEYINREFQAKGSSHGVFASLVMTFDAGANWIQNLIKYAAPVFGDATGTKNGITIPVTFNGSKVRRITAYQASGRVGPHSGWWQYLQYGGAFDVDHSGGTISFKSEFFGDSSISNGWIKAVVEFYDGQIQNVWMNVNGNAVISSPSLAM